MGRLLGSIFGLRTEERTVAILMALYHFLLLVSLYLLKPVRDSLFLSMRGAAELPFVFILTTVVVMPVAFLHTRAGRRLTIGPLVDGGSLLLVISLVALRGGMAVGGEWVAYLLYAWVSIYGLLVTSQFWLVANAIFTASQAKRIFPLLSAGAILGAIAGGELTGLLVNVIDVASENLLLGAGGVLMGATGVSIWGRQLAHERGRTAGEQRTADPLETSAEASGALSIISNSRHIQFIIGILTLMVVVTTLVDYQFKTVAVRAFASEEALTTFMGHFYGRVSIVALVVQFALVPRLMRMVGIQGALSVLPAILAVGTVGMLVMPGLVAGVFLRGAGQSFKHSVDKTGRELLFVPVPLEKKKRVKVFVDLFVDQGAQGLGGLILLVGAYGAGISIQMLSIGTLGLIAMWGVLTYGVQRTYVDQFRAKLREQEQETDHEWGEQETDEDVLEALCSQAEGEVRWALDLLEEGARPVPVDALLCLLDHPTPAVRAQTIRVLRVREVAEVSESVAMALRDPDPDVQLEAARYLYCQLTDNHLERLQEALDHDDPQIQAAAVALIAEEGGLEEYRLVSESLLRRLVTTEGEQGREIRTQVARILGVLDRSYRDELLHPLLHDEAPSVVRAAIRAVGRGQRRAFVPMLVRRLGDDAFASSAQKALASFGTPILGTLYDHLRDDTLSLRTRLGIPAIFAARPSQLGGRLLVRSLSGLCVPLRHAAIRALSTMQASGAVDVDPDRIDSVLEIEIERFAAFQQMRRLGTAPSESGATPVSKQQLVAWRDETLEAIFRLLGLRYDQRDLYDAYLGLTSENPVLRDSAVEFVDNLVEYRVRRALLPLLDDSSGQGAGQVGRQLFNLHIQSWAQAREYLTGIDDPRYDGSEGEPSSEGATDGSVWASASLHP